MNKRYNYAVNKDNGLIYRYRKDTGWQFMYSHSPSWSSRSGIDPSLTRMRPIHYLAVRHLETTGYNPEYFEVKRRSA